MKRSTFWMLMLLLAIQAATGSPSRAQSNPPTPALPDSTSLSASDIDKMIEDFPEGRFVIDAPKEMAVGNTETVHVRIDESPIDNIASDLSRTTGPENIRVGPIMDVEMTSDDGQIRTGKITPAEQPISKQGYTEWEWNITAQEAGHHKLNVAIEAPLAIPSLNGAHYLARNAQQEISVRASILDRAFRSITPSSFIVNASIILTAILTLSLVYAAFRKKSA